ncbi:MAG: hypothetical protein NTZ32_09545, partial [Planctomycetales bacterium]|nr:hypothetical protein [Planctomycetales bacterium]
AAKGAATTPDPAATPDKSSRSQPTSLQTINNRSNTDNRSRDTENSSGPIATSVANYQDRLVAAAEGSVYQTVGDTWAIAVGNCSMSGYHPVC